MKNTLYIALLLLGLTSCQKETFTIVNLNGSEIYVLGHGGMGMIANAYPINSLESIGLCLLNNAHGSEIDVQLTSDGVLVAYHDHDLSESTDMSGIIHSMTWEEVQKANYTNLPYQSYDIVSLENILSAIDGYDSKLFTFDIKLYPADSDQAAYHDQFTDAIVALFNKYKLDNSVYIESQNTDFLTMMQSKKPNYMLYIYPQTFEEGLSKSLIYGFRGMTIASHAITVEQVQEAHDQGVYVTIWGVVTKDENIEAVRKNPDVIQTDKVEYLVDLLQ
ncbi:MAG: glycerophosphodiester phosphodiesterase family protein [Crocinitomicaceae bacterium]|nr:glycerophosphodiester phosphodiesterase family protein [Crocinitomicaceae bacterium]